MTILAIALAASVAVNALQVLVGSQLLGMLWETRHALDEAKKKAGGP